MVRKIGKALFLVLSITIVMTSQAMAATVYDQGNISNTYTVIFEDIVNGLDSELDYVFFRSDQYSYTMIVGDIDYDGSFSAQEYKEYTYSTSTSGYNSTYNYSVSDGSNFSLNPQNALVYSNLGDYPVLTERGTSYEYTTLFTLCIIGVCMLLRPIFNFCMRPSSRYDNNN